MKITAAERIEVTRRFLAHPTDEQAIMYAAALRNEYYELLAILDGCIAGAEKPQFLQQVEHWAEYMKAKL
jgi:hypothetical protein